MSRFWPVAAVAGVIVCLPLFYFGCRGGTTSTGVPAAAPKSATVAQTEIEDQLKSALFQLQPENLGIDSRVDDAVSVLNNWWSSVKGTEFQPTGLTPPAIPPGRVPDELRPRLEQERYDLEDGRHIRAAYLAKSIADRVTGPTGQELERIVALFDWVCRNVTIAPEEEQLPFTFYEILIVGRGSPSDRALVFGEILKQRRLDTVVLRAKDNATGPLLVGVPWEGEVYLFDPQLGLPVPRGDEPTSPRISRPATLRQVREHPDWLKALAARSDQPYEPSAEQLADPHVNAITSVTAWTARMWNLEQLLPGESLCFVYEAPDTLGEAPGIFARIAAADTSWKPDQIRVWAYPLQRQMQFAQVQQDPNLARVMQAVTAPLSAPVELKKNDAGEVQRYESMRQLKSRTVQLLGAYANAVGNYVSQRHLAVTQPPDPAWAPIYKRAAEDAYYWSCVCKFETGEFESAVTSLTDYMKRYRRDGNWLGPAALLLAECHRELNELPKAIQALKTATPDEAYRPTLAILAKRWGEAKE